MQVKEIMSHPVVTCRTTDCVDQAARLMWEFDCGVVPVVDNDGRLAGVITDRDICMAAYTQGKPLNTIPITSAMATRVIAVHSEDLIEEVEALLREHQIHRLPVLDREGRLAGVVSLTDLARLAARAKRSGVDRELVNTLAAICQPRPPAVTSHPSDARPVALAG